MPSSSRKVEKSRFYIVLKSSPKGKKGFSNPANTPYVFKVWLKSVFDKQMLFISDDM